MRLRCLGTLLCLLVLGTATADDKRQKTIRQPVAVFNQAYLSNPANIQIGKIVWEEQCRHCHGAAAYPGKAPKLNPGQLAPDLIYDRVTFGFGKMPAWKDVFSDEQRKGVVAYIKSSEFSP